eukprot:SM000084S23114  [mRNA]  locus=s84:256257:265074:+ [translate_table: standard]
MVALCVRTLGGRTLRVEAAPGELCSAVRRRAEALLASEGGSGATGSARVRFRLFYKGAQVDERAPVQSLELLNPITADGHGAQQSAPSTHDFLTLVAFAPRHAVRAAPTGPSLVHAASLPASPAVGPATPLQGQQEQRRLLATARSAPPQLPQVADRRKGGQAAKSELGHEVPTTVPGSRQASGGQDQRQSGDSRLPDQLEELPVAPATGVAALSACSGAVFATAKAGDPGSDGGADSGNCKGYGDSGGTADVRPDKRSSLQEPQGDDAGIAGALMDDSVAGGSQKEAKGSKRPWRAASMLAPAPAAAAKAATEPARLEALPLPPCLAALEGQFGALNAAYGFLQKQHIQATWQNVAGAVRSFVGDSFCRQDLYNMALLCPDVVIVRDFPYGVADRERDESRNHGSTSGRSPNSRSTVEDKSEAGGRPEGVGSQDSGCNDGRLSAKHNFLLDLVDPSRPASGELKLGAMMPPAPDEGPLEHWDLIPGPGGKRPSDAATKHAVERRRRAFRRGLAAAVRRVHRDYFHQLDRSVDYEPVEEGSWHPDFPLQGLALQTLLAEASAAASAHRAAAVLDCGILHGESVSKEDSTARPPLAKWGPPRPPRALRRLPRCTSTNELDALAMLEHLREGLGSLGQARPTPLHFVYNDSDLGGDSSVPKQLLSDATVEEASQSSLRAAAYLQIVHCERRAKREASYGQLAQELSWELQRLLLGMGIKGLFIHQTSAINAAMVGRSVIIATATASGKSLCYNLPVLQAMQDDCRATALYLFPTKALAQDQQRALLDMLAHLQHPPEVAVYDGDTLKGDRGAVRETARIIISNPDMLHVSILPSHRQFERILSNLKYIVVDEAHAYRGVFGCHTALILRRLRRVLLQVYGCQPSFIICSATVANPREHAQELVGIKDVEVVLEDGSPCGEKVYVLWNPPLLPMQPKKRAHKDVKLRKSLNGQILVKINKQKPEEVTNRRSSPIVEVAILLAEMVQHGLRCLAFCKTRKLCELVLNYTRETLKEAAPALERRSIERDLFGGQLRGVAATNALELGVDVGSLDATIHLGWQGTVASLWQQAGRAGRREKPSIAIYVAWGGPLDQYFMKCPQHLFNRRIENAQVDSHNPQVMEQHVMCAAVESPLLAAADEDFFGSAVAHIIDDLAEQGLVGRHPTDYPADQGWYYIGPGDSPAQNVGIRAIDPERYVLVDGATNEIIEDIEESKAFFQVYEGAVYMQQGRTYLVTKLDLAAKVAVCRQADLKYYTKTSDMCDVYVMGGTLAYPGKIPQDQYPSTTAQCSPCKVTARWLGFRRIWHGSNEAFDYVQLFLPDYTYETQCVWIRVPRGIRKELEAADLTFRAGLHAASHALLNVLPLYVMCNPADMSTECANPHDTRYFPERLLMFDRNAGGIGICAQARPMFAELLQAALELVTSCDCTVSDGCPNCVQYMACSEYNAVIDKSAALIILKGVIRAENAYRDGTAVPPLFDDLIQDTTERPATHCRS